MGDVPFGLAPWPWVDGAQSRRHDDSSRASENLVQDDLHRDDGSPSGRREIRDSHDQLRVCREALPVHALHLANRCQVHGVHGPLQVYPEAPHVHALRWVGLHLGRDVHGPLQACPEALHVHALLWDVRLPVRDAFHDHLVWGRGCHHEHHPCLLGGRDHPRLDVRAPRVAAHRVVDLHEVGHGGQAQHASLLEVALCHFARQEVVLEHPGPTRKQTRWRKGHRRVYDS